MASVVGSVRYDSIVGRERGRFLRFWPLSVPASAVAGAVCRRRIAGAGALYKRRIFGPLTIAALLLLCTGIVVNWPIIGVSGPGPSGYNNLANAYSKEGKIDQAIETAKMAIQLQPDYGVAHFNLGNFYAAQGRFDLAQTHFEEALRLYPNYAEAHSNFGNCSPSGVTWKAASGSFVKPLT